MRENKGFNPFPALWPEEYRRHALDCAAADALLSVGDPSPEELRPDPDAFKDPVGESPLRLAPFLYRKYPDRVLFTATSRCFFYCRFCFRRGNPPSREREPSDEDIARAAAYVGENPEVKEVIFSGGDPLTLGDDKISRLIDIFGSIPSIERLRLHTRAPVVNPSRVGHGLCRALLGSPRPLRVIIHAVHPDELRPTMATALEKIKESGTALANQSVLLKGVNDRPETLDRLFASLFGLGVAPHYLHHPDRAEGNAKFRVSIREGLGIFRNYLKMAASPPPRYVIDLPDGSGKVNVSELVEVERERNGAGALYRAPNGFEFRDIRAAT